MCLKARNILFSLHLVLFCCCSFQEEEAAHFITYRNNLNKIIVTPYSKQKWEMEVGVCAFLFSFG